MISSNNFLWLLLLIAVFDNNGVFFRAGREISMKTKQKIVKKMQLMLQLICAHTRHCKGHSIKFTAIVRLLSWSTAAIRLQKSTKFGTQRNYNNFKTVSSMWTVICILIQPIRRTRSNSAVA